MKKILNVIGIVAVCMGLSYATYSGFTAKPKNSMLAKNIEALSQQESSGGAAWNQASCHSMGGNWNMASICVETGFETVKCTITGKIKIFDVEITGSYERGNKYKISWARYSCCVSDGNCCIKQGLYSGNIQLA